jgi:hypothetical protein
MKIKQYEVCSSNDFNAFIASCNKIIATGFSPYKGITTNLMTTENIIEIQKDLVLYTQAFVKYEEESNSELKERKVVDVMDCHSLPSINNVLEIRDLMKDKGWTLIGQGHKEFNGWYLKMVKYEN